MRTYSFRIENLIIFFISLLSLLLELFFTRILSLKTFTHVVYVVIPFAMLGYGIGTNLYLILEKKFHRFTAKSVLGSTLLCLSAVSLLSSICLIYLPVTVTHLTKIFVEGRSVFILCLAYLDVALPFIAIGFIMMFLFAQHPKETNKLYFWDLVGAGCGAWAFFLLINHLEVFRSLVFLSLVAFTLSIFVLLKNKKWIAFVVLVFSLCGSWFWIPEIQNYSSDYKGWENFPGIYPKDAYETQFRNWHSLGRTDAYRLKTQQRQDELYKQAIGTFEINVAPRPEFTYLVTNFFAGTPVYNLSSEGLKKKNSRVVPFTQAMEFPYLLLKDPKVIVIGAGGGRDIFMARTHGAKNVVGAEINPSIVRALSKGGALFDYSGGIYEAEGVKVWNLDGRHLIKKLPANSYDLVILNGVDTFSGLSSGAYTFAESYLYTKNAIQDYLRVINSDGFINLNRWIFLKAPRETLRLFVIVLDALAASGIENPCAHVIIGSHEGWGMMLVKKSPFSWTEINVLKQYFKDHDTELIYPSRALAGRATGDLNFFDHYAVAFISGKTEEFIKKYPFDISVITDNNPFFYKYYRFKDFHPKDIFKFSNHAGAGLVVFLTQTLVLAHAVIFILLFIGLPLLIFKRDQWQGFSRRAILPMILYFSFLGLGFMFVEIPLMQKFVLLLGSPIYSLSVTLAALLIFSGLGSLLLKKGEEVFGSGQRLLLWATIILIGLLSLLMKFGELLLNSCIGFPLLARIGVVCIIMLPLGLCLGVFFPSGLRLLSQNCSGAMPWAWGINFGFSVLGSMLAIMLAQFLGFNIVLVLAVFIYLLAFFTFCWMAGKIKI